MADLEELAGLTIEQITAFEDFLNEPPRRYDVEPMEVRDFRHEAYRKWEPICRALVASLRSSRTQGNQNG